MPDECTHPDCPRRRGPSGVGPPPDPGLPLFAYGLLKPGELAHESVIGGDLVRWEPASFRGGVLRIRDGLPFLATVSWPGEVHGALLWFEDPVVTYERVGEFEPRKHYRWEEHEVWTESGECARANVLIGYKPTRGAHDEPVSSWSSSLDPVLRFGFPVASEMTDELTGRPFPGPSSDDDPAMWDRFFRLSSAYLLLWSIVERYTALKFGPALAPTERVKRLDCSNEFRAAVVAADVEANRRVVDSRDPGTTYRIRDDGSSAAEYWYAVRSNLSHRGKGAYHDGKLLHRCTLDLRNTIALLLMHEIPALADVWKIGVGPRSTSFIR